MQTFHFHHPTSRPVSLPRPGPVAPAVAVVILAVGVILVMIVIASPHLHGAVQPFAHPVAR